MSVFRKTFDVILYAYVISGAAIVVPAIFAVTSHTFLAGYEFLQFPAWGFFITAGISFFAGICYWRCTDIRHTSWKMSVPLLSMYVVMALPAWFVVGVIVSRGWVDLHGVYADYLFYAGRSVLGTVLWIMPLLYALHAYVALRENRRDTKG